MKRFLLSALVLCSVALAQAELTVEPYGDQTINADNSQVLAQGGVVNDSKHGVKIDAKYIEFKAGEYVRAKTATIITKNLQRISTASLNYQIKADRMAIAGPLSFSDEYVKGLSSGSAVIYPDAGVMVGIGGVTASSPQISATAMVVDGDNKEAFLFGNYRYKSKDGKLTLSNQGAQAGLLINFTNRDKPRVSSGSDVPAGTRARFIAWIERSR
jgi:hypothetical protein